MIAESRDDLPAPSDGARAEGATVRDAGEFGVIRRITAGRVQPAATLIGPGDDAAVVSLTHGTVVASVDMLVEGRHFRTDWSSPHDIGRKSIAQNAADMAAMGARPLTFLVGLGCPADTPLAVTDALNEGLWEEASAVGAGIGGGDLVQSPHITVSVTALGDLDGRRAVLRSGARPGDLIAMAGETGYSAAGLELLTRGIAPGDAATRECVAIHRTPRPPYREGVAAAEAGAHAMIDTSDGLLSDLGHIARASGVRIDIDTAALGCPEPVRAVAAICGTDAMAWVLDGGEDHALVAAFAPQSAIPENWRLIGSVSEGEGVTVDHTTRSADGWTSW
ncbi:thiamine-phosphate kinase [Hoyosella altamirensis]|uniref:Thiamine-monophosphate kinase n=1 Tax=Hoyosella altamirensis TaxID=616997 RepID=A0A839RJR1_9ACTN|nr:thiamine-phosphate kinase [Hoyosella altamirensis]MBB3036241.1 thiamine-monophosphate kinase [Hoyosella altamirensis]